MIGLPVATIMMITTEPHRLKEVFEKLAKLEETKHILQATGKHDLDSGRALPRHGCDERSFAKDQVDGRRQGSRDTTCDRVDQGGNQVQREQNLVMLSDRVAFAGSRISADQPKDLIHYEIAKTLSTLALEKSNINRASSSASGSSNLPPSRALH